MRFFLSVVLFYSGSVFAHGPYHCPRIFPSKQSPRYEIVNSGYLLKLVVDEHLIKYGFYTVSEGSEHKYIRIVRFPSMLVLEGTHDVRVRRRARNFQVKAQRPQEITRLSLRSEDMQVQMEYSPILSVSALIYSNKINPDIKMRIQFTEPIPRSYLNESVDPVLFEMVKYSVSRVFIELGETEVELQKHFGHRTTTPQLPGHY